MGNIVRCYDYYEINEDLLTQFSEGDKALESLLKFCYQNRVETQACCAGHEEEGPYQTPYIGFVNSEKQAYIMESLINRLFQQDEFSKDIEIWINKKIVSFRINSFDNELRDKFFNTIERIVYDSVIGKINEPGKYEGLFEAYKQVSLDKNMAFRINQEILKVSEFNKIYFLRKNGKQIQISEKRAMRLGEKKDVTWFNMTSNVYTVNHDEIEEFISSKKDTVGKRNI